MMGIPLGVVIVYLLSFLICLVSCQIWVNRLKKAGFIREGGYHLRSAIQGDIVKSYLMGVGLGLIPVINTIVAAVCICSDISETAWWNKKLHEPSEPIADEIYEHPFT